jgi:hypothetical protein
VRRLFWTIAGLWLCGAFLAAAADDYPLTDGTTLSGDVISYNDNGVVFRVGVDKYSQRIPWTKFSQDALQTLSKNPKIKLLAEPFIETTPVEEHKQKAEIKVHEVSRMELPPRESLFGALFQSSIGLVALMLIYAANIFAGYEIAVVRSRPIALVMGVAVVLPILGPIIFLALPMPADAAKPAAARAETAQHAFTVPGVAAPAAAGIHIVEASWQKDTSATPAPAAQVFQRGQTTFNRRFFETKLSGFFAMIRREADKNLVLTVKTGRQIHIVERITRIATNEMHIEVYQGANKQELMVPFAEILEVAVKPKEG